MFLNTETPGWPKALIEELDEFDTNYRLRLQIPPCARQSREGLEEAVGLSKLAIITWLSPEEVSFYNGSVWLEVHMPEESGHRLEADIYISPTVRIKPEQLYQILLASFACAGLDSAVLFQLYERVHGEMDFLPCGSFVAEYAPTLDS